MKSALLALLSLATLATAQESPTPQAPLPVEQTTPYVGLGLGPFPVPLPNFSIGLRTQKNHHGFDASIQASTIVEATAVKLSALYEHYFKPNLRSQFYVGGGLGTGALFHHRTSFFISPEFILGKQYQTESNDTRFFQAQISFPTLSTNFRHSWDHHRLKHDVVYFPLVVLTYGIGF